MPVVLTEINNLIEQSQLKKANSLLQTYFRENGIDSNGQKTYLKLQKALKKYNTQIGEQIMQEIKNELKHNNTTQALEKLQHAKSYLEHDTKFKTFYLKTIKQIQNNNTKQAKKFFKLQEKEFNKLIKSNQEATALNKAQNLCAKYPNNPNFKILLTEVKKNVVKSKLNKNKKRLNNVSNKEKLEFYLKLYELDKNNKDIKIELAKAKKAIDQESYFQKDQYLLESEMQIKVLYNTKKFQKCHKACEQLLRYDPNNKKAQKYYKKSKVGLQTINLQIAYQKIKDLTNKK